MRNYSDNRACVQHGCSLRMVKRRIEKNMKAEKIVPVLTLLAFFLVIVIPSAGCKGNMVLEKRDIGFFQVEQMGESPVELNVAGLAMHSAYVVSKIETFQSDDVLVLKIYSKFVLFAPAGASGSFAYHVVVPETVRKVVLGKEQAVIWMRN